MKRTYLGTLKFVLISPAFCLAARGAERRTDTKETRSLSCFTALPTPPKVGFSFEPRLLGAGTVMSPEGAKKKAPALAGA